MHIRWFTIPCIALLLTLSTGCATVKSPETAAKSSDPTLGKRIFNGRNLDGWVVLHGGEWTVEDGVLIGRRGVNWTTDPEKSGSWLRTAREYEDFSLDLEFAVNEKGNSGIFIRSAIEKNPAFTGHEMQILDDSHREKPATWSTGALYGVVAATRNMSKPPGEWNHVRIEARGPRVQIWMNGSHIIDHEPVRSLRGYIGLQNHDETSEIRFRNIWLREL